jgi:predicted metal-dependent HD superfamily phosphohydrolase
VKWPEAIATLGSSSDAWPRLEARYGEPHRRYHTLHHAAALLDADLAILGAPRERYTACAKAVREEYAKYPDDVWRDGRIAVLEGMLARTLYRSEAARTRWASAARANLTAELTHWRREPGDHR